MTDINPLPALPDELPPRAVDLPFEIEPEHVELFSRTLDIVQRQLDDDDPREATRLALAEVVKLVWIEHVLPIEQALDASERDVATAGRALHAARKAAVDLSTATASLPGAEQREQVARAAGDEQ